MVLLDNDVAYNEAVIEERAQGIGENREANEIFKDLAVLVCAASKPHQFWLCDNHMIYILFTLNRWHST